MPPTNSIHFADQRHPVDFIEPLRGADDSIQRICGVLGRTFGWVAEGSTMEQKGLRASVVLFCVRADLIGADSLEELGALAGLPEPALENLVTDLCHTIGWK